MTSLAYEASKNPQILEDFTPEELLKLEYDWPFWARRDQLEPEEFSNQESLCWLVLAGRGWGKAVSLKTAVATDTGFKRMKDIHVGDTVFDMNGKRTRVIYESPIQLGNKCYKITFDDKTEVVADAAHLWWATSKNDRKHHYYRTSSVTTEEMSKSLIVTKEGNWRVPVALPLDIPKADLPNDPYTFGLWLGDGSTAAKNIFTADEEIRDYLVARGATYKTRPSNYRGKITLPFYSVNMPDFKILPKTDFHLQNITIKKYEKYIPIEYLRAAYFQRHAVLEGLMDSDGWGEPKRLNAIAVTNARLATDIFELVASLGYKPRISHRDAKLNGEVLDSTIYEVDFAPFRSVFRLKRKQNKEYITESKVHAYRTIKNIEEVPSVPVKCIQVDSNTESYLITRSFIPTHNTKTGAETTNDRVRTGKASRIGLIAPSAADARDVMVEGPSGIVTISPPWFKAAYHPSRREVVWPNGAKATIYSAEDPDQLRGPQHDWIWMDELATWPHLTMQEVFDNAMFGLRQGLAQYMVTTTPRPIELVRNLVKRSTTYVTKGSTYDNLHNLSQTFRDQVVEVYEGTRLGRQELHAEILDDYPEALWTWAMIERNRVKEAPELKRVGVAIDPAGSRKGHEVGIVGGGVAHDGQGYLLADKSVSGLKPNEWGKVAVDLYHEINADFIVVETNFGGEMVENVINNIDSSISVKSVRATRGKTIRAEPVSMLYERDVIHHVGIFSQLEEQLTTWLPEEGPNDRLDANVWLWTQLRPSHRKGAVWFLN